MSKDMKVWMTLISKPGYSTRAIRPFEATESWARMMEVTKSARRLTPEELAQLQKPKAPPEQPISSAAEIVTPESKAGKYPTDDDIHSYDQDDNDMTRPAPEAPRPRHRGRPRKTETGGD